MGEGLGLRDACTVLGTRCGRFAAMRTMSDRIQTGSHDPQCADPDNPILQAEDLSPKTLFCPLAAGCFWHRMNRMDTKKPLDCRDDRRSGRDRAGDYRRRVERNGRSRVVPAGGGGPSRDPSSGGRSLANGADGGGGRLARAGPALSRRDPVHPLRVVRRAGRNAGHARRPRRPGGLRRRADGHSAGTGQQGRCHRHRAAAQGSVAPCGARLSRPHRTAGPRLRRRRLCDDAVFGAQRRVALARRLGRGPRHAAHGDAERVCPVDRGGDFGQGPAGPSVHVAVDAVGGVAVCRRRATLDRGSASAR